MNPRHFSRSHRIRFSECDPAGIVFYPQYFVMFNDLLEAWVDQLLPEVGFAGYIGTLRQGLPGCASPELLNEAERRRCRDDFDRRAAAGPPIRGTGNPERDARFARQGARRLAEWEQLRRPLSGGVGVVGPADCVGSNFGTGCAGAHLGPVPGVDMQQGARTPINPGEQRPQGFSASIGGLRIGGKDD